MSTELAACEFEDSINGIWDAQKQGNGIGESFSDIEGETFYIEAPFTCPEGKAPGWLNEHGEPTSCVDNNPTPLEPKDKMVIPEVEEIEVPEPIESLGVTPPPSPEYIDTPVLAETGAAEVITGVLVGIALLVAGAVLLIQGRKNK